MLLQEIITPHVKNTKYLFQHDRTENILSTNMNRVSVVFSQLNILADAKNLECFMCVSARSISDTRSPVRLVRHIRTTF